MSQPHIRTNSCVLSRHAGVASDGGRERRLHFSIRPEPALDRQRAEPESSRYLAGTGDERYRSGCFISESARRDAARRGRTTARRFQRLLYLRAERHDPSRGRAGGNLAGAKASKPKLQIRKKLRSSNDEDSNFDVVWLFEVETTCRASGRPTCSNHKTPTAPTCPLRPARPHQRGSVHSLRLNRLRNNRQ